MSGDRRKSHYAVSSKSRAAQERKAVDRRVKTTIADLEAEFDDVYHDRRREYRTPSKDIELLDAVHAAHGGNLESMQDDLLYKQVMENLKERRQRWNARLNMLESNLRTAKARAEFEV